MAEEVPESVFATGDVTSGTGFAMRELFLDRLFFSDAVGVGVGVTIGGRGREGPDSNAAGLFSEPDVLKMKVEQTPQNTNKPPRIPPRMSHEFRVVLVVG